MSSGKDQLQANDKLQAEVQPTLVAYEAIPTLYGGLPGRQPRSARSIRCMRICHAFAILCLGAILFTAFVGDARRLRAIVRVLFTPRSHLFEGPNSFEHPSNFIVSCSTTASSGGRLGSLRNMNLASNTRSGPAPVLTTGPSSYPRRLSTCHCPPTSCT